MDCRFRTDENMIVGIGASAGGLEAIQTFFANMPDDVGLSFVIVQHLSPDFKSMMGEILQKYTNLNINSAEHGQKIEPNNIYLIPPKNNMTVRDGHLLLTEQDRSHPNMPINIFFTSMAMEYGENCVAVVLSGTGSDGSRGILDVSGAGGLVLVQNPENAKFDGMPKSAIITNCVNQVLDVEKIPNLILSYYGKSGASTEGHASFLDYEKFSGEFSEIFKIIFNKNNLNLENYKSTTINRRIVRRMKILMIENLEDYIEFLKDDSAEIDLLTQDLIIGVTAFFRDEQAFSYMQDVIIPRLFKEAEEVVRIWICACSTGEEAYSLALLFEEYRVKTGTNKKYKIFATDLLAKSIEFASAGIYPQEVFFGLRHRELVDKYFINRDNTYQVTNQIRSNIVFTVHNVVSDAPFTNLSLITCRNMLIYFKPEIQRKIIGSFYFGLKKDSILFLGPSEHLGDFKEEFLPLNPKWKVFSKNRDVKIPLSSFNIPSLSPNKGKVNQGLSSEVNGSSKSIIAYEYEAILRELISNGIIINNNDEVTHMFGPSREMLSFPEGRVGGAKNVFQLINGSLRVPLSTSLRRAKKEKTRVVVENLNISEENKDRFRLTVKPLGSESLITENILVILEKQDEGNNLEKYVSPIDIDRKAVQLISDLEAELNQSRESLQATIEELESTNEELQSTNEEMIASNEELQSTNEELQSVNEELYTVNSEHQDKIRELMELNSDMDNLMASTQIATVFVNDVFEIRKFTPALKEIFNVLPSDIGRSIFHFTSSLNYETLSLDIEKVISEKIKIEKEIADKKGTQYILSITPYEADYNSKGAVLTFVDISKIKDIENDVYHHREALDEAAIVAETDLSGNITYVNEKFIALSKYTREELIGKNHRIINSGFHQREFFKNLWGTISKGQVWRGEICNRAKDGSTYWVDTLIYPKRNSFGKIVKYISIRFEITQRIRAENEIRSQRDYLERIQDVIYDGYWDWHIQDDYEYYSPRFWELLGYDPNTKRQHPSEWQKLIHPDDLVVALDNYEKHVATRGEHLLQQEVRYRHSNGSTVWVNCKGKVVEWDSEGKPLRLIGTHSDITKQKELQQRYELVVEGSSVGIWDWMNVDESEEIWSEKFYELLGYKPGELVSSLSTFKELLHPDDRERTFEMLEGHLNKDDIFDLEYRLKTKAGEYRWFRGTGKALKNYYGKPARMAGSIMDIHELKMAIKTLKEEQLKMVQSAKMASIGEMAAGIAHEINNPLTVIKGKMRTIERMTQSQKLDPDELRGLVDKINSTVDRVSSIVKGLKNFSRNGEGDEIVSTKVSDIISDTLDFCFQRLKNDGIEFRTQGDAEQLIVNCRPLQISQVLLNLIQNSRDEIYESEDPWIEIKTYSNENCICIRVTDSGTGISVDQREKIFDPFYSTKQLGQGTGLGLSLSRELVESHGGKLYLDGDSLNTSFVLMLPSK